MLILHHIQAVILVARALAQTCSEISNTDRRLHTKPGKRLTGYTISYSLDFQILQCAMECLLVKRCKSLNYSKQRGFCELSSKNLNEVSTWSLQEEENFEYHDIRGWPAEMVGTCASRPCGGNQRCIPSTVYTCVDIDCGLPPQFLGEIPMFTSRVLPYSTATTLGSSVQYYCATPWGGVSYKTPLPLDGHKQLCCSDFAWKGPGLFCKSYVEDCKAVKQCNPKHGDGHYWIFWRGIYAIKVYCHDMESTPKTYLTLPIHGNYAKGEARTVFHRVRLDIDGQVGINGSDFTFATVYGDGVPTPYGQAGICRTTDAGIESSGEFAVNLRGTGMQIARMSWAVPGGLTFQRAGMDDVEVEGSCFGICEHCAPSKQLLYLYVQTKTDVDTADTINPDCTTDYKDFW